MSFYTGKDNSNDAIMHITNGVTPQSSMKSGVLANSIFHSSLPYLELEVHKMIRVNANTLEAPISFINSVGSKQPFFLTVDGVLQNFAMDLFMYRWHSSSYATTNWPTNTYKYIRKASTTEENYAYIIKNINKTGTTVLLVEQNANMALSIANRGYVLETGKIVLSGTGQELLASEDVQKAYLGG